MSRLGIFSCLLCLMSTFAANANPVQLEYEGFFDRMEVANEEQYDQIELGFYLIAAEAKPCHITQSFLQDRDGKQYDMHVDERGQIHLPFDKQLDTRKARLIMTQADESQRCQLSIQVQAKTLKSAYPSKELEILREQMTALLDDLGGMLSFLLPDVGGLVFWFEGDVNRVVSPLNCEANKCQYAWSDVPEDLIFPIAPVKITALIKQ